MCGRFTQFEALEELCAYFDIQRVKESEWEPIFNIAPTQTVLAIVQSRQRWLMQLRWGLIPSWAKDAKMGAKLTNARIETLLEKPSFKQAFHQRRCIIPANGFYEWTPKDPEKQPYFIHQSDFKPLAFAAIYEHWISPEGERYNTCAIITQDAGPSIKDIHHRQPLVLDRQSMERWLNPRERAQDLFESFHNRQEPLAFYPVDKAVNSSRYNASDCFVPLLQN